MNHPLTDAVLDAGILRIPSFLDSETCAKLLGAVRESTRSNDCRVFNGEYVIDPSIRRHRQVTVPPETLAFVQTRLRELLPFLAARFGKRLSGMQEPEFYVYEKGDFIIFHRDANYAPDEPEHIRGMKVSVVLFLSDEKESTNEAGYEGGALEFYAHDMVPNPAYEGSKVSVHGRAGLLVAFDPGARHQVQEVRSGTRVTVVTWFT